MTRLKSRVARAAAALAALAALAWAGGAMYKFWCHRRQAARWPRAACRLPRGLPGRTRTLPSGLTRKLTW